MGGARPPLPKCYWLSAGSGRSFIGSNLNNGQACLKRQCLGASRAAQSPSLCHSDTEFAGSQRRRSRGGRALARARGARSRRCFAGAADAKSQSAAKLPAQHPSPLHPSPRKEGEARTTAASEGEGKTGCWAALTPGGACAVPAEIPAPHAWAPSTKNCSSAVGVGPTTSVEGCEAKARAPGRPARLSYFVHPSLPSPGGSASLGLSPPLPTTCPCVHPLKQPTSGLHAKHARGVSHIEGPGGPVRATASSCAAHGRCLQGSGSACPDGHCRRDSLRERPSRARPSSLPSH